MIANSPHFTATGTARAGGAGAMGNQAVSRIGFGAMQLRELHADRAAAIGLLRRAAELGADHVDTAHFYGDGFVNGLIRDAFRPQDGVVTVSKVGADPNPGGRIPLRPAQRPEQLRASVEDNLASLGADRIPVVNLRRLETLPGILAEGDQVVDVDDQLAELTALRDAGKIGAIGLSAITLDTLRRALPAGIACVQNAYSVVSRGDEEMLRLCTEEHIAWVPFFPLGGAFPAMPKVVDEPAVITVARELGHTPAQVGLAWLLHHAPNVLLIPGTAKLSHLEANIAAGSIELDEQAMAALDAVQPRSAEVTLG
ncbi:aldo/keto reductase [Actinocrispum sp. NPDC049592]|uniref:aldo/keto reductase n=1 Tax=Actinocrispum sp. NPDC049592 TaxID=3154835 RepID=UPI00341A0161